MEMTIKNLHAKQKLKVEGIQFYKIKNKKITKINNISFMPSQWTQNSVVFTEELGGFFI